MNCLHLHRFNSDLYSQLVRYPQEVIPTFDLATNELFSKLYPDTVLEHQIQVGEGGRERRGREREKEDSTVRALNVYMYILY